LSNLFSSFVNNKKKKLILTFLGRLKMLNERARERGKFDFLSASGERRNLIKRERERKKMPRSSTLAAHIRALVALIER